MERKYLSVEDDVLDFVDVRDNRDMDNKIEAVAGVDALDVVNLRNVGRFLGVLKESSSSFLVGCGDKFWLFFFFFPILFLAMVDDPLYD